MIAFNAEKHEYRYNGVVFPSVTQILADMGLIDTTWFTDYSRERGTLIHRIIQWHLSGELDEDSIDPSLRPYFDAFLNFERDSGLSVEAVEQPMFSITHQFAGTPDIVGVMNKHNAVIDIKSGTVPAWVSLQLAGQELLIGHPSIERFSLQLTGEGKYKLTQHKDRQDRQLFLSALALYNWKNNQKG